MQFFWYKFTNEFYLKILQFITIQVNDDATDSYIFTQFFHIVKIFLICNIYILSLG